MNNQKTTSALLMLLMLSVNLCFASTLSAPYEFQILAVNGKKIEKAFFSRAKATDLKEGTQKITVVYNTTVKNDQGRESTRVSSQKFIVTLKVKKNESYWLEANSKLNSLKKAKKFARYPEVKIETKKGKAADFSVSLAKKQDHGLLGNLFYKEEALTTASANAIPKTTPMSKNTQDKSNMAGKMLHHWWQQADKKTRTKFIEFAKNDI
jgi:uncharacterized protein YccT (UPF0319 family)